MNDLKNQGWVRLHRQITDNSLWFLEPFTKAQAWVDLFLNANHKDGVINIRGNIIAIRRGQIGWSELTMTKRWKWSKNKVRRYLNLLETAQQITQTKSPLTTVITIVKYEQFQQDGTTDDTTERQQKDNRRYTNKNDKNEKNITAKAVDEYDQTKGVGKLLSSARYDLNIIGYYFKRRGLNLPTKELFQKELRRALKETKTLKTFDKAKIKEAMDYAEENYPDWTIETVGKVIVKLKQ